MNNTHPRPLNYTFIFLAIIIGGSIAVVLISAIAGEQLGDVVSAIAVIGAIFIAAFLIVALIIRLAADPLVKLNSTQLDRQIEANRHEEAAWKNGIWISGRNYIPLQLPQAAIELDDPIDMHGVTNSTVAPYRQDALEVVALSVEVMTQAPNQIVTIAKAKKNEYFSGKEGYQRWQNGCAWLLAHQWIVERKEGERVIGRFCTSGTVAQLYDRLKK